MSFSTGMKIEEIIKKYNYVTNKTDTITHTVVLN